MDKSHTISSKFLLFLVFSFIIHCTLFIDNGKAQPSITWQRLYQGPTYGNDILYSVCNAENGNFYSVGAGSVSPSYGIFVLKLNPYGDTIWTKIFRWNGVSQYALASVSLNEGSLVLTGGNDTAF